MWKLASYFPVSVNALKDIVQFMGQDALFSKASVTAVLDEIANVCISENLFWEEL